MKEINLYYNKTQMNNHSNDIFNTFNNQENNISNIIIQKMKIIFMKIIIKKYFIN